MSDFFDILAERGFIEQHTDKDLIKNYIKDGGVSCYVGYDATAESLHAGSLLTIMVLAHFQRMGNKPIAIVGGGTTLIGDPSGKTTARRVMTKEEIDINAQNIKKQLSKYISFDNGRAMLLNNADWLCTLEYIPFLRDIGKHFSVNRMLTQECYKMRMETGLSFIEFNYMLLQAYDFYYLCKECDCRLQIGGSDQWGNITAGIELIRRKLSKEAYAITVPLIMTSGGQKMGKSESGAIWLDDKMLSPFEFYQFFRNVDDRDVERFLSIYTFLPMDEVRRLGGLRDKDTNNAKEILAYETTKISHGEEAANKARNEAKALFYKDGSESTEGGAQVISILKDKLKGEGIWIVDLFVMVNLAKSKGEARRLIEGGGAYIDERRIESIDEHITGESISRNEFLVRAGKKKYSRIKIV